MFYKRLKKKIIGKWANRSFSLFWWAMWAIRSQSLISSERCERIAQVAHQKWAMWANCSGCSPKMSNHERIAQIAHQKWANQPIARFFEQIANSLIFSQKTSDLLRKPISEFPALLNIQDTVSSIAAQCILVFTAACVKSWNAECPRELYMLTCYWVMYPINSQL